MYRTLSSTVCTCKPCQQSKPHQCNRFFSRGHDPFTQASKARPLAVVGRTSLSVSLSFNTLWRAFQLFGDGVFMVSVKDIEDVEGRNALQTVRWQCLLRSMSTRRAQKCLYQCRTGTVVWQGSRWSDDVSFFTTE